MAAAVLAGLLAAGCTAGPGAGAGAPSLTPSEASAAARAAVLRPGELAGYRPAPALGARGARAALARCLGLPGSGVAHAARAFARAGGLEVDRVASQVTVFATARAANGVAEAMGSQAAPSCLEPFARRALVPLARRDGLALQATAAVAPLAVPVTAPAGAFAYRMALSTAGTAGQPPIAVYLDLAGFADGRAVVELETVSAGSLFPARLERRLLAALAARARSRFG